MRQQDAEMAARCGADYLGFVFHPSSARFVGDSRWGPEWLDGLEPPKVAVFAACQSLPSSSFGIIQAHSMSVESDREVWPVLRLGADVAPDLQQLHATFGELGRVLVLDAFHPTLEGGAGITVDWGLASAIREAIAPGRLVLAGGLTPENVSVAIQRVRPYAVDVASGVELSPGVKDAIKLESFTKAVKDAC